MNKQELIEAYTKRLAYTSGNPQVQESRRAMLHNFIDDLQELDEPKAPEVVVPQWFADWIEDCPVKDKGQLVANIWCGYFNTCFSKNELKWLRDNKELATRAILDGYKVKKEQLYYVKLIDDICGYYNQKKNGKPLIGGRIQSEIFKSKFTEAEIKAINPKYWEFRVPVEEETV